MNKKVLALVLGLSLAAAYAVWAQAKVEPAKPVASTTRSGKWNAITDVPGVEVGSYDRNFTGTTVILIRKGAVGGVEVRGSAPGTRETDLLRPTNMVDKVDAVVLSGGSAYGLAAAGPRCHPLVATIPAVVALQLFSYHVARIRGCEIDQPRNLAKSVTVE